MTHFLTRNAWFRYGVAAIGLAVALFVTSQSEILVVWAPYTLFILTAIITTWLSGWAPGLLAVSVSPILINYFILSPHYTFEMSEDRMMDLVAYFFVGVVVVLLTAELRKGRSALEKSEEYYRYLFSANPFPMFIFDRTTLAILAVNDSATAFYGYTENEMLSMSVKDIRRQEMVTELMQFLAIPRGAIEFVGVTEHQKKDGSLVNVEIFAHEMDFRGTPARQVIILDVTEKMRIHAEARESDLRYRNLFDNNPLPMAVYDSNSLKFLALNDAAIFAYGYSEEEFLSMTLRDIRFSDDIPAMLREFDENPNVFRHVGLTKHVKKDGTVFEVEVHSHKITFDGIDARQVVAIDISDRTRVEAFARETEARMTSIIENMTEGLIVTDHTGRVIVANPRVLEIFEVTDISHIGGPHAFGQAFEMFELDRTPIREDKRPIARLLADQLDIEVNVRVRKKGSDWERVLRYGGTIIPGSNGDGSLAVVTITDVTERTAAEEAERASEERFRVTFEQAAVGIAHVSPEGKFLRLNQKFCSLVGHSREEMVKLTFQDITHPDDLNADLENVRKLLSGVNDSYTMEKRYIKKSGDALSIRLTVSLLRKENGDPRFFVSVIEDITEHEQVQNALKQSQKQLAGIIGSAMDAIITIDVSGKVLLFNSSAETMFGCSAEEAIGGDLDRFIPQRHRNGHRHHIEEFGRTNVTRRMMQSLGTLAGVRENGEEFPIEASISQFETGGKKFYTVIIRDITSREMADEALRASEERYRDLVENAQDVIYTQDLDGRFTSVNNIAESFSGFTRDEMLGMKMADIVAPEYLAETAKMLDAKLAGKRTTSYETELVVKDGRRVTADVNSWLMYQDGVPVGIQGIARDITEKKKALAELRAAEHRFGSLVQSAQDIIYSHDLKGNFTAINDAGCRMSGYSRAEALQMNFADIMTPESFESVKDVMNIHLEGGPAQLHLVDIVRKDGSSFEAEVKSWVTYRDGVPFGIEGIARDITERSRAEALLRASEERLNFAMTASNIGAWDLSLVDSTSNRTLTHDNIFGYEELLPEWNLEMFLEHVVPEDRGEVERSFRSAVENVSNWNFQCRIRRADGEIRWIMVAGGHEPNEAEKPFKMFGIVQDITGRIDLEDKLRQSQKLEAVGLLAGGIAHDFNNLLTVISGYSDLTLKQMPAEDPARKNIEQVKEAGARAAELTGQLLAFSRKQVLKPTVHCLNSVITNIERMLKRIIRESVDLKTDLAPDLFNIKADPGQIEQVIMNLAVNARDAMVDGGTLTISTRNVFLNAEDPGSPETCKSGSYVSMTVTDTGEGMSAETKRRLFEPFYTTKGVGKGSGLGLSTVHGIVKQSGGEIRVDSVLGKGTTFDILFPCVEDEVEKLKWTDVDLIDYSGTETILVVEDDASLRELIETVLVADGYRVLLAADGRAAIDICERSTDAIHLLLTDVVMPQMSGIAVRDRVLKLRPGIRVIFMSGYTEKSMSNDNILESGAEMIKKPFLPDSLSKIVREMLDRK